MKRLQSIILATATLAAGLYATSVQSSPTLALAIIADRASAPMVEAADNIYAAAARARGIERLLTLPQLRQRTAFSAPERHLAGNGAFGSVAIPVGNIAMADKWDAVQRSPQIDYFTPLCDETYSSACTSAFGQRMQSLYAHAQGKSAIEMIRLVNREVNAAITYRTDARNWGLGDYWATPVEIARNGMGDCEDYATVKMGMLRALGLPVEQLQLVIIQDTRRRIYHAVLAVHLEGERYILDNLSNAVRSDSQINNYMPLVSFVSEKSYIHGFESRRTETAALPADLGTVQPGEGL